MAAEVSVLLLIQTSTGVINLLCQDCHPTMMRYDVQCYSDHTVYCFHPEAWQ